MPALNDGDMVAFDYTLFIDGKPIETSLPPAEGAAVKLKSAAPVFMTVGLAQIIQGLEEDVREHALELNGTSRRVLVAAEKAFGLRSKEHIHTVPIQRFGNMEVKAGMQVNMGGIPGTVTKVGGGRAVVDTHHQFAGKTLEYEYSVRGIYRELREKVQAIAEYRIGAGVEVMWEDTGNHVAFTIPERIVMNPQWPGARRKVVESIRYASEQPIEVSFIETYKALPAPAEVTVQVPKTEPAPPA